MSSHKKPSLLIALGGNALDVKETAQTTLKEEFIVARKSVSSIVDLFEQGYERIVITHGNGPQVGKIFLQQELTKANYPRQLTLDQCVADTQGRIGNILQNSFYNVCKERGLDKQAVTVVTQVLVDGKDQAFQNPTKPIGSFYTKEEAETLTKEKSWVMKEEIGKGFRRVVPSPAPIGIIERDMIKKLVKKDFIVICGGGGGIPVVTNEKNQLEGVEAVIDKDKTSALLAELIETEVMIILTEASHVFINYGKPDQKGLCEVSLREMEQYVREGHFPAGSMGPKVEAAMDFIRRGGKRAIIANLYELAEAIQGKTGTHILP